MGYQISSGKRKKRISLINLALLLLFSMIAGFSLSSVLVTGGNIEKFYNGGEVWIIPSDQIHSALSNIYYEPNKEEFMIVKDQAEILLDSSMRNTVWKYLDVCVFDISADSLNVEFHYYGYDNEFLGTESVNLLKGNNRIEFAINDFSYIRAEFLDQIEKTFSFDEFRITTQDSEVDSMQLLLLGIVLSLLIGIFINGCFAFVKKMNWRFDFYILIENLQKIYIKFGEIIPESVLGMRPQKKHRMRIVFFTMLFLILTGCNVFDVFLKYKFHRYVMLVISIILLCLAFLSSEGRLKCQNWKNSLTISWFTLWGISCISDFVVTKRMPIFSFNGYIMIFICGFLFFVWSQKEDKRIFWEEICRAVEFTFFLSVIFCLFCRPEFVGFRYNGAYTNPNPFGLYLAVVGCIFLCEFDHYIFKGRAGLGHLLVLCSCMSAILFFIWKTKCRTAILALAAVVGVWIWGHLRKKSYKGRKRHFFTVFFLTVVLYLPVSFGLQWGINTLPYVFDTAISYPGDLQYVKNEEPLFFTGDTVYADEVSGIDEKEELSSGQSVQKFVNMNFLNNILSGRITNFKAYLKSMNLFGHKLLPKVYGASSRYAHNGILTYAYAYGVFSVVPYILAHMTFLYYAFLYWKEHKGKDGFSYLPLSIGLVFLLENMLDNVDIPFHWIIWFIFLFVEGTFFDYKKGNTVRGNKKTG